MKSFKLFLSLFAIVAAAGFSSCAHQVSYPLTNSDKWTQSHVPGSVRVDTFQDKAPRDEKILVTVGDELWRVNGREGYPGGQIAPGVSKQVAAHIDHSGLFQKVYYPGQSGKADYVLSGTISDYNATGRVDQKAESTIIIGAAAGSLAGAAIGAAATKDKTTEVSSTVQLSNVQLKSSRGGTVWSRGGFREHSEASGVHFLQSDAPALYNRADAHLKEITTDIVQGIGRSGVAKRGPAPAPTKPAKPANAESKKKTGSKG